MRAAMTSLSSNPALDEEGRKSFLDELYERHVRDHEDVLERLGFLEEPDPAWHRHQPSTFTPDDAEVVTELLALLHPADKIYFKRAEEGKPPRELLTELHRGLSRDRHRLDDRLRAALDR
jgi:hypothetical protein